MNTIETLTEVFALASGAVDLADKLIEVTKGKGRKVDGSSAQIGSSGSSAKIGSSGDYAQIGSSGDYAQIGSSGDSAQIGSSGYSAQIGSSGSSAKIGSSGSSAKIGSSGDYAQIGSSGSSAKIGSSGDYAQIGSSGDSAQIGSSGDYAQIDSTGEKAVVSAIGFRAVAKAKVGSWITLAEYKIDENKRWVVDFVKTEYVDGEKIKGDTFYCLYKHEFRKYVDYDKIPAAVLNYRKGVYKVVTFDDFVRGEITYIVEKDGVYSHGKTIKEARESFIYKISNRDTSAFGNMTLDTVVSFEEAVKMYRVITGACEFGTKSFVNRLEKVKKEYTVAEIIKLTSGQYGADTFKNFFKEKKQ